MVGAQPLSSELLSVFVNRLLSSAIRRVTSIPDNRVLTLTHNTPGTNETEQCSDPCWLSTDPSVPYQDFLFDSPAITGLEVVLTDWIGAGPGLHLLQLLSDGESSTSLLVRF
jgi:hypothetical protein